MDVNQMKDMLTTIMTGGAFKNQMGKMLLQQPMNQPNAVIQQAATQAEAQPASKGFFSKIIGAVGKIASNPLAQKAAQFIPGVGPAISTAMGLVGPALSSNDDEWFDGFKAAGATANEPLGFGAYGNSANAGHGVYKCYALTGCMAEVMVTDLLNTTDWRNNLLPTILAYVRKETNNVLNAQEEDYWKAFKLGICMYAMYYAICADIELVSDIPLNIPTLSSARIRFSPGTLSQYIGLRDNLKDYLSRTIKIPYALAEYLRWRFGTTFLTSCSDRAGIIRYVPAFIADGVVPNGGLFAGSSGIYTEQSVAQINTYIESLKGLLSSVSRAAADITLAYAGHAIRYNVDPRHYDAKEFNLRSNMKSYSDGNAVFEPASGVFILQDSHRENKSALMQATTLSTDTMFDANTGAQHYGKAPFHVDSSIYLSFYVRDSFTIKFNNVLSPVPVGWVHANSAAAIDLMMNSGSTSETQTDLSWQTAFARQVLVAMEFHNDTSTLTASNGTDPIYIKVNKLSYDTAFVSWETIRSTQMIAVRNLIRGDYKQKTPEASRDEVIEAKKAIIEAATDEMKK